MDGDDMSATRIKATETIRKLGLNVGLCLIGWWTGTVGMLLSLTAVMFCFWACRVTA